MKIPKIDHFFRIGKSHDICQDYTRSFLTKNGPVLIVSDGCSANIEADIAARIITLATEKFLRTRDVLNVPHLFLDCVYNNMMDMFRFMHSSDVYANDWLQMINDMTATLVVAYPDREGIYNIFIVGDGYALIEYFDDTIEIMSVDIESVNMPCFLSYKDDLECYNNNGKHINIFKVIDMFEKKKIGWSGEHMIAHIGYGFNPEDKKNQIVPINTPEIIKYFGLPVAHMVVPADRINRIILATDGIDSFYATHNTNIKISANEILSFFAGNEFSNGVYLQRRYKVINNLLAKHGYAHYDDIGIASIVFSEKEG